MAVILAVRFKINCGETAGLSLAEDATVP